MCVVSKAHTIKVTLFIGYNFRGFWFTCVFADIVFSIFYYAIKIDFVLTHVDMLHHIPKRCRHVTHKFSPVRSCGSISLMHLLLGFYENISINTTKMNGQCGDRTHDIRVISTTL